MRVRCLWNTVRFRRRGQRLSGSARGRHRQTDRTLAGEAAPIYVAARCPRSSRGFLASHRQRARLRFGDLGYRKAGLRERLMTLYLTLDAFPEVPALLKRLKQAG